MWVENIHLKCDCETRARGLRDLGLMLDRCEEFNFLFRFCFPFGFWFRFLVLGFGFCVCSGSDSDLSLSSCEGIIDDPNERDDWVRLGVKVCIHIIPGFSVHFKPISLIREHVIIYLFVYLFIFFIFQLANYSYSDSLYRMNKLSSTR